MARIYFILKKKVRRIYYLFFYIFFLLAAVSLPYICNAKKAFLFSVGIFLIYIAIVEVLFRIAYRIIFKKPYSHIPKIPFNEIWIEPHPYLPFVYKKKFLCQKEMPAAYPLHQKEGYMLPQVRTNNFRHINGPEGDRDIEVPKPKGLIRINCLGDSPTGSYIRYEGKNYSYPMELEKILRDTFPDLKIEVNNCGQGGYTSAEILIKFLLDTIDTGPDVVVIYNAYNDIVASLTPQYQSDYSHARKNLGEVYHLYRLAAKIPDIPLASCNFLINYCIFSQNIRFSLLKTVSRGRIDVKMDFQGLDTYKRNIEHVINICKANNIQVILSTFSQYLYPQVRNKEVYLKHYEGIKLENKAMRDLAAKHNLPLVDNACLLPQEDKYFLDTVHFTPEGMRLAAGNISGPIIDYIKNLSGRNIKR